MAPAVKLHWPLLLARGSFGLAGIFPWALPIARATLPLGPLGYLFDKMFVLVCHRMPERTLVLSGVPMPLCSRCAGIALGFFIGALAAWPRPSMSSTRFFVGGAGILMLLDVLAQDFGIHPVWHSTRLLTGALLGLALSLGLFALIRRERALNTAQPNTRE
ncbi:MAG: DUF2085 domain-containing protein [Polyangiaceae bacterium]|nr:DUF2085 domain-containing protein [Polyangiaceae bacterium]